MLLALPVAAFFLAMGLVALAAPARIPQTFGIVVNTPEGRTEVRAVYGGFGVTIGALIVAATMLDDIRTGVYIAGGVSLFGMAGGRVVSLLVGEPSPLWPTWAFCALELALGGVLLAALAI